MGETFVIFSGIVITESPGIDSHLLLFIHFIYLYFIWEWCVRAGQ